MLCFRLLPGILGHFALVNFVEVKPAFEIALRLRELSKSELSPLMPRRRADYVYRSNEGGLQPV
jgi:hypothetical protein